MNPSFYIAKRYLFSKKSQNVINLISAISVFGILVSTAAMVIVISAFNGIEGLVVSLFNSFESDITIQAKEAKTFNYTFVPTSVFDDNDIAYYTPVIEETVIIKHEDHFTFGVIKGVEPQFLDMVQMDTFLLDGHSVLNKSGQDYALVGVGMLQNLSGYIYQVEDQYDLFTVFTPNRNEKIKRNSTSAFEMSRIPISGTFSFNNKVDESYMLAPIQFAKEVLGYDNDITSFEIDYKDGIDLMDKKQIIQAQVGKDFKVVTKAEQNELIFKTSKTEKWLTVILLGFIFFLGTFNMIASLAMLMIEKKDNLQTLKALGSEYSQLENVFFYVGGLINAIGILLGLGLGYLIVWMQDQFGLIRMEGGMVEYFPVDAQFSDFVLILLLTVVIGTLSAFFPSKLLINRLVKE